MKQAEYDAYCTIVNMARMYTKQAFVVQDARMAEVVDGSSRKEFAGPVLES